MYDHFMNSLNEKIICKEISFELIKWFELINIKKDSLFLSAKARLRRNDCTYLIFIQNILQRINSNLILYDIETHNLCAEI